MVDLLDCPFCGSSDVFVIDLEDEDGRFAAAGCSGCGAGSRQHYYCGDDAKDFAADAWNRRPTPPPVPAVTREELVGMINRELRSYELHGGNILDAIATYHNDKTVKEAMETVGDWSAWLADAILSRLAAGQQGGGHD